MTVFQNSQRTKRYAAIIIVLMMIVSVMDIFCGINTVNAASKHTTTLSTSAEQVKVGSSVTLTASARIDGTIQNSGYTYRFLYNTNPYSGYQLCDYSSSNVYTFKPSSINRLKNYTGPVYVFADSKNSSGTSVWSSYKIINIVPDDDEALRVTGSVTSTGSYTVGDRLLITMTASGGKSPYQYKYEYAKSGGGYSKYKDYSSASSITMATDSWTANTDYNIRVTVKDSNNDTFSYVSAVRLSAKPVPTPSISSFSVQSTAKVGDKIKLNCDVKDGTAPYKYKFTYINPSNQTKVIKDYSTTDNATWNTSSLSAGSYTVKVEVKDKNNKTASQKATIKLNKTPTLSPTVSTDPNNATVVKGKDITFTVDSHSDGSENYPPQPYKYKFDYKKKNASSYTILKDYSDNEKYKYNTKDLSSGDYVLKVTVKDNNGKEYSKTVNFTVEVPKITFSVSPGSKDFFTGGGNDKAVIEVKNVKGGTSDEYEYKFEYVKYGSLTDTTLTPPTNSSSWQKIKDFGGESSADFTVSKDDQAGIYAVRVSVQNKGNTNNSLIYRQIIQNYTVKVKVQHTLANINTLIDKIDTWTSNSIQGDMQSKIEAWSPDSEHYDEYPFSYTDYKAAYDAAKASNTDGNKDYDTLYSNLETQFDGLQRLVKSGYVSSDLNSGNTPVGWVNSYFKIYKSLVGVINSSFKVLAGQTVSDDINFSSTLFSFNFDSAVDTIFNIFKVLAYSLIIIFAGVNALETALQYEMFTMRGGVKILGRLTLAKVWVDVSLVICRSIVQMSMDLLSQVTALTNSIMSALNINVTLEQSSVWIIGPIIDMLQGLFIGICVSIVLFPLFILVAAIYIKLFIRLVDISLLQSVSPVFFACLTGESTKPYFKKFIMTYISVVVEVLFMAVIWYFYVQYMGSVFNDDSGLIINNLADLFSTNFLSLILVSFAASILTLKPPKVLKTLVE